LRLESGLALKIRGLGIMMYQNNTMTIIKNVRVKVRVGWVSISALS